MMGTVLSQSNGKKSTYRREVGKNVGLAEKLGSSACPKVGREEA